MLHLLTLTWNSAEKLTKLKESLLPALEGINYNWLIKDNDSKDNTFEIASEWKGNTKVIKYKNNLQNFSEGMNYLFNEASPADNDYIMLLNNDVVFNDTTSIKNMMSLLKGDVGVVGARLFFTGTNNLQHAGVVFDPKHRAPLHFRSGQKNDKNSGRNRLFQAVTGAVLLTKAEYFKNICTTNKSGNKGMSEEFQWAFDDIDLCLSIHYNMSKKILYCGNTNIFHEESASLKKNPVNRLFMPKNLASLRRKWDSFMIMDREKYEKDNKYNLFNF